MTNLADVALALEGGAYDARRAAELSGVRESTLNRWARTGLYTPSIAAQPRVRLWSWSDLLTLRAIDWFRREKGNDEPSRTRLAEIRATLTAILGQSLKPSDLYRLVAASKHGTLYLMLDEGIYRANAGKQALMPDTLPLIRPYTGRGPDLLVPAPLLRIIPGKLHGEPHVIGTRIPSRSIYRLEQDGYSRHQIASMYPDISDEAIDQCIELERSLSTAA